MKLSVEDYRTIGKITGVMGAVTAGLGLYLVFIETSNPVVALFLFSWGITFISTALYARKAIQVLRLLRKLNGQEGDA